MRILHYLFGLPPVYVGGLVAYALDLARQQALDGNEVAILIPGEWKGKPQGKDSGRIEDATPKYKGLFRDLPGKDEGKAKGKDGDEVWGGVRGGVKVYAIPDPLPVSYGKGVREPEWYLGDGDINIYREFLENVSPDIVHVHSFMGLHKSFLQAARQLGKTVLFTTHDYYGLCPKATFLREGGSASLQGDAAGNNSCGSGLICQESGWGNCYACCEQALTAKQLKWQHSDLCRKLKNNALFHKLEYADSLLPLKRAVRKAMKRVLHKGGEEIMHEDLRKQYEQLKQYYVEMFSMISYFHFNSTQTRQIYEGRLGNCPGEVLSVSGSNILDRRKEKTFGKTLRIGYLGGAKEHKGYQLLFQAADALWNSGRQDFVLQVYGNFPEQAPYLEKREPYGLENLSDVFGRMDVLVMPSLWQETFGLVVLEAISFGVPVIISDLVGAKDLLGEALKKNNGGIITQYGVELCMNMDCFHQYLVTIYDDREILRDMNRNICRGRFDFWEEHVAKVKELYKTV